jgi:hypothetical protein
MGDIFLNSDYIKSFEIMNRDNVSRTGMKYLQLSKGDTPGSKVRNESNELKSQFAIISTDITSKNDESIGIFGGEVLVKNRISGEELAKLRYFWNHEDYDDYCPSFSGILSTAMVPIYVLGFGPEDYRSTIKGRLNR